MFGCACCMFPPGSPRGSIPRFGASWGARIDWPTVGGMAAAWPRSHDPTSQTHDPKRLEEKDENGPLEPRDASRSHNRCLNIYASAQWRTCKKVDHNVALYKPQDLVFGAVGCSSSQYTREVPTGTGSAQLGSGSTR